MHFTESSLRLPVEDVQLEHSFAPFPLASHVGAFSFSQYFCSRDGLTSSFSSRLVHAQRPVDFRMHFTESSLRLPVENVQLEHSFALPLASHFGAFSFSQYFCSRDGLTSSFSSRLVHEQRPVDFRMHFTEPSLRLPVEDVQLEH